MARLVRDTNLETRTARGRLKARGKPYYRALEPGLHLGYRKPTAGAGKWVVRHYTDAAYEVETVAIADDYSDPDGTAILDYRQAVALARTRMVARVTIDGGTTAAPMKVGEVVADYVAERNQRESKRRGRQIRSDAGHRLRRYVLGQDARGRQQAIPPAPLTKIELHALDDSDLRKWRTSLPDALKGTTKQRLINDLKAALNAGYERHRKRLPVSLPATIKYGLKVDGSDEEETVVPDSQVLTDARVTALIRAARDVDEEEGWNGDLYRLVVVLAATGARFSQVTRLRVRDCQLASCRLLMPDSRKGRKKKIDSKTIPVERSVIDVLRPVVVDRAGNKWLLERWRYKQVRGNKWERAARGAWSNSELTRPWDVIRKRAGMPEATPYCLRHSSIVRDIRANLPTRLVAAKHDTSEEIIRRHYARWITSDLETLVRDRLVPLLPQDDGGKVVALRGGAQ